MSLLTILPRRLGSAAFAPTDIAGLQLWLKADSLSLSDTDPVGTWADSSGQGNDATQATAAKKPIYKANIQNGKPVVRFDGVDDVMAGALTISGTSISIFAVAARNTSADYIRIFSNENNAYFGAEGGNFASFYGNGAAWGVTTNHGVDAALAATTFYVLTSINDGANDNPFVNGADVGARANTMAAFADGYDIGAQVGGVGQFWDRDIAELIVYNAALNATQRGQVHTYLGTKYNITIS